MKKSKTPKVSVLVPVYNVEKFLPECLESLVNQTLKDLEIICINDGSTDNSPEILQKFTKKDPRLKIITKKNSGYGDSMNRGLKAATGEYIGIVESDDFAEKDMFEQLYNLAKKFDADLVKSNFYEFKNGKNTLHHSIDPAKADRPIDPLNYPQIFYQPPAIWSALYRRDFLLESNIDFLPSPGASYQDTGFNLKVLASTSRAVFTTKAFLHYRLDNENSSVKSAEKVFCLSDEYAEVERWLKARPADYKTYMPILLVAKFANYHWNLLRLRGKSLADFFALMQKEFSSAKKEQLLIRKYWPLKYWFALNLMLHCPNLFLKLFRLRQKI